MLTVERSTIKAGKTLPQRGIEPMAHASQIMKKCAG